LPTNSFKAGVAAWAPPEIPFFWIGIMATAPPVAAWLFLDFSFVYLTIMPDGGTPRGLNTGHDWPRLVTLFRAAVALSR